MAYRWAIILILIAIFISVSMPALADYTLQMPLPGLNQTTVTNGQAQQFLGQYLSQAFIVGFSLIGFLAVVVIAVAGIQYILAAGNPGKIDKAKEMIFGAISGIILLFCSYLILSTIGGPSLTNLVPMQLPDVNIQAQPGAQNATAPNNANNSAPNASQNNNTTNLSSGAQNAAPINTTQNATQPPSSFSGSGATRTW